MPARRTTKQTAAPTIGNVTPWAPAREAIDDDRGADQRGDGVEAAAQHDGDLA